MNGEFRNKGIKKWKLPSAGQAAVIIAIFAVPIAIGVILYDYIPGFLRPILFIGWFITATIIYIYILSHGKGKQKYTIVNAEGLSGEFSIDNNYLAFSSVYFFAASLGAMLNGFYLAGFLVFIPGITLVIASKYFRKKLRFDDNGNLYILQKGEEFQIDFNRLKFAECRLNKMSANQVYRPGIILQFIDNFGENRQIKLKINVLRSSKFGTYSDPRLIIYYIKVKCSEQNMKITYSDYGETDFIAERI